ncbi:hypothetical protein K32_34920 [Kaistia sp. 32K]|uniref:MFS transporter n=1 Tax=Kaistia sp. 32K TaxID=2795690 RepID=UPI001915937A|nr:MFS transporter [Kaistia sp. 32K]BCP54875.1 hypothetical protein K32_34920 [Kaistia sp. 32K]
MASRSSKRQKFDEIWLLVGLIGINIFLALPINLGPLQTGALMDGLKLSSSQAGVVGTIEPLIFSIVLVCFPRLPRRFGTRTLGVFGLTGAIIGNVASGMSDSFATICFWRLFVGASTGLVALAGFAALATAARVDRMSALVTVVVTLVGVGVVVVGGNVTQEGGFRWLFWFSAAISIGCAVIATALPERRNETGPPLRLSTVGRSPLAIGTVAYLFAGGAVWPFVERIGVKSGLTVSQVGEALGFTLLAGLAAGVAALALAKPGRERTLAVAGILCFGGGCAMLTLSTTPAVYISSLVVMFFFFVFVGPFLTALAMKVDGTGGLAAAIMGWSTLISSLAPAVSGRLVEGDQFDRMIWLVLASTIVGVVVLARGKLVAHSVPPQPETASAYPSARSDP